MADMKRAVPCKTADLWHKILLAPMPDFDGRQGSIVKRTGCTRIGGNAASRQKMMLGCVPSCLCGIICYNK